VVSIHIHEQVLKQLFRPDVKFFCDLDYDPFLFMEENKKLYGKLKINRL
jgi:hypothetical protein